MRRSIFFDQEIGTLPMTGGQAAASEFWEIAEAVIRFLFPIPDRACFTVTAAPRAPIPKTDKKEVEV